ncbi:MAG: hypothetical protein WC803_11600 [Sphingomonas sp.]
MVLSNQKIAEGARESFPIGLFGSDEEGLFNNDEGLRAYLAAITYDDARVLFANPTIDDHFLENVLALGDYWQAMPERARRFALRSMARNPRLQTKPSLEFLPDGSYKARRLLGTAWRLVIALDANNYNAYDLSHLYENLAPECITGEGILEALPKWIPQNETERESESKDNQGGQLSSYQSIRQAASAMLLHARHLKQEHLLASEDNAIRCGAYLAGRFSPEEMNRAIRRGGWLATASFMQNPNCWRTFEHREVLDDSVSAASKVTFANAPELAYWEMGRWKNKFESEHPDWFEWNVSYEPDDKPLTESSIGDLAQQIVREADTGLAPAFASIDGKLASLARSQQIQFWLVLIVLAILLFRS